MATDEHAADAGVTRARESGIGAGPLGLVPFALVASGAVWLLARLVSTRGVTPQRLVDETRRRARSARVGLDRSPLIVPGLGLAGGLALGALLPTTRLERDALGPARERLLAEGRRYGEELWEGAKTTGREALAAAAGTARDAASEALRR